MALFLNLKGYDVTVTEVDETIVEGLKHSSVATYCGHHALEQLPSNTFAGISLFHSLEHMEQPDLLIRKVKTLLQPSGQVFIEIPIFTKWSERLKSGWFHLDYPRHLALMTLDGFAHIIQKHRFTIVEKHSFSCEFSAPSLFNFTFQRHRS